MRGRKADRLYNRCCRLFRDYLDISVDTEENVPSQELARADVFMKISSGRFHD